MAITAGSAIGAGAGLLGGLITLKSQQDLLNRTQRDRRGAELAARQASDQMQRGVVSAAQQSQGGVGLLQGLRAADQMQRRALPQIQQAKMADLSRQDAFDLEQRGRQERLYVGLGNAVAGFGTQLAMSEQNPSQPGTGGHSSGAGMLGALTGMGAGTPQQPNVAGATFAEPGDAWGTGSANQLTAPRQAPPMQGGQALAAPPAQAPNPANGVASPPQPDAMAGMDPMAEVGMLTPEEEQLVVQLDAKGYSDSQKAQYILRLRGQL